MRAKRRERISDEKESDVRVICEGKERDVTFIAATGAIINEFHLVRKSWKKG